jgi:hypothetical protein
LIDTGRGDKSLLRGAWMRGALALRALDFDQRVLGGASFLVKQNVYRNFDFKRAGALVDVALAVSPLEP